MSIFGTVLDKVQGLFSRAFLLGAYFPVLISAMLNFAIAYFGLIGPGETISKLAPTWWPTSETLQASALVVSMIFLGVIAYILSALTNLLRGLLEGEFFSKWLKDILVRKHRYELDEKLERLDGVEKYIKELRALESTIEDRFKIAVKTGNDGGKTDETLITTAETECAKLRGLMPGDKGRTRARDTAIEAVLTALKVNRTLGLKEDPEASIVGRLDELMSFIRAEISKQVGDASRQLGNAWSDVYDYYVPADVRHTRIGNLRAVTESYSEKAYGVRFDYLWPRLQFVLTKEDKVAPLVELAKTQLDFSVLMLCLIIMSTVTWLLVLPCLGVSLLTFLIVAVLGPMAIRFFVVLLEQSQAVFGATLQAAIDGYRLDVLARLRLPLPDKLSSERERWRVLQQLTNVAVLDDMTYERKA